MEPEDEIIEAAKAISDLWRIAPVSSSDEWQSRILMLIQAVDRFKQIENLKSKIDDLYSKSRMLIEINRVPLFWRCRECGLFTYPNPDKNIPLNHAQNCSVLELTQEIAALEDELHNLY